MLETKQLLVAIDHVKKLWKSMATSNRREYISLLFWFWLNHPLYGQNNVSTTLVSKAVFRRWLPLKNNLAFAKCILIKSLFMWWENTKLL